MVSHRPRDHAKSIVAKPAARHFPAWILKTHEKIHTGEKTHKCPRCDKHFSDKSNLNKHLKVHDRHTAVRTFTCNTCGETFQNLAPYNAHIHTAHQHPQPTNTGKRSATTNIVEAPPAKKTKKTNSRNSEPQRDSLPSSSWQEDPRAANNLPMDQQSAIPEYRRHWQQIRTRFNRRNRLLDWYNYRLSFLQPQELVNHLDAIFADQSTVFKLNFSFGFILRNNETGDLQYHHSSANNNLVLEQPFLVSNNEDLERLKQEIANNAPIPNGL